MVVYCDKLGEIEMKFNHVAKLIREAREKTSFSRELVGKILGYKQGQMIANIELGKCSVPIKVAPHLLKLLSIRKQDFFEALIKDYREQISQEWKNAKRVNR